MSEREKGSVIFARVHRAVLGVALLTVALVGTASLSATEGKVRYRQLVWEDFPVDDSTRPGLDAWTHSGIDYSYRARFAPQRGQYYATVARVQFTGYFDPSRSWRKSRIRVDPDLLLEHEQGHFTVNELTVRRLRRVGLETFPTGTGPDSRAAVGDLDGMMSAWFDARIAELQREHARYDDETDHGRRRARQGEWTRSLQANLRATDAPAPSTPRPDTRAADPQRSSRGVSAWLESQRQEQPSVGGEATLSTTAEAARPTWTPRTAAATRRAARRQRAATPSRPPRWRPVPGFGAGPYRNPN